MPEYPVFLGEKMRNLVQRLLVKDPSERLGSKGSMEIKNHPWFEGVDWEALMNKSAKAPFVPSITSSSDVSNFDEEFTSCPADDSFISLDEVHSNYEGTFILILDFSFTR